MSRLPCVACCVVRHGPGAGQSPPGARGVQGTVLKRSKIPKSSSTPGSPAIAPADLAVGGQLELYGKVVLLTDADDATRQW